MEEKIKQRLIGILVIIGALFIILPFLFHNSRPSLAQSAASNLNPNTSTVSVTLPTEAQSVSQNNIANNTPVTNTASAASQNNTANNTPATNSAAPAPVVATQSTSQNNTANNSPVTNSAAAASAFTRLAANTVNTSGMANTTNHVVNTDPAPTATQSSAPSTASAVITSATSGSVISSSGLTKGEGDDQPDAMQKQTANAMPIAPIPNNVNVAKTPVATQPVSERSAKPVPAHTAERISENKSPTHAYAIQVGAFDNAHNAEQLVAHLRQHHFEAYSRAEFHDNRKLVVVFVGSINNLHQAELDKERIDREFHINGEIRKPL